MVHGWLRLPKLARTVADLVGEESIGAAHLPGAPQYRPN